MCLCCLQRDQQEGTSPVGSPVGVAARGGLVAGVQGVCTTSKARPKRRHFQLQPITNWLIP